MYNERFKYLCTTWIRLVFHFKLTISISWASIAAVVAEVIAHFRAIKTSPIERHYRKVSHPYALESRVISSGT